jgi:hypothetical protein
MIAIRRRLQGVGWRTVVSDDRAAGFVARTRRDGEPNFTIRPPGRRPVYYVTVYSYPRIPFSSPLGPTPGPSRPSWPRSSRPATPARPP